MLKPSHRFTLLAAGLAGGLWGFVGCSGDDAAPVMATPLAVGPSISLLTRVVSTEPASFAATLSTGEVVLMVEDEVRWVTPARSVTLDGEAPGTLRAAARVEDAVLLASERGVFAIQEEDIVLSPLSEALGVPPWDLAPDRTKLWVSGPNRLVLWQDGRMDDVDVQGLPSDGCVLSPSFGGVWVTCRRSAYRVSEIAGRFVAQFEAVPADVIVQAEDEVLFAISDGGLWARRPSEDWQSVPGIGRATHLTSDPVSGRVWILGSALWVYEAGLLHPTTGVPATGLFEGVGHGLVQTESGVVQAYTEPAISVLGLAEGAAIATPTEVMVYPVQPELVSALTAAIDDVPVSVETGTVALDPATLPAGRHTLTVEATYTDGRQAQTTVSFVTFVGEPPAWSTDIQPLFEVHCAICHDAQGSARPLETRAAWQEDIDLILLNVRQELMPLPPNRPLTAEEIGVIEGWQAAGFPAGE